MIMIRKGAAVIKAFA